DQRIKPVRQLGLVGFLVGSRKGGDRREKSQKENGEPPVAARSRESAVHCLVVSFTNQQRTCSKERAIGHGTDSSPLCVFVVDFGAGYTTKARRREESPCEQERLVFNA